MASTNAKQEFLSHITYSGFPIQRQVLCAIIQKGDYVDDDENLLSAPKNTFVLTTGYTEEDWNDFLSKMDFMYDSGWGSQNLFGTIWYTDETWSSRWEYDGSEGWEHNFCPEIPDSVRRIDKERDQKLNKIIDEK
jgi:hypothetical protein